MWKMQNWLPWKFKQFIILSTPKGSLLSQFHLDSNESFRLYPTLIHMPISRQICKLRTLYWIDTCKTVCTVLWHKFHSKLELKCDLEKRSNQRGISSLFQITVVWYIDCRVLFVFKILCSLWYTILGNVVSFVIFLLLFR